MREQRTYGAETRAMADGRDFFGQAAVFDTEAPIGNPYRWGFYEKVNRAAFDQTIAEDDIVLLSDHDPAKPLARTSAGTLSLSTSTGLDATAPNLPSTSYGNDLVINLQNGNVRGMSFGFEVRADDWSTRSIAMPDGSSATVDVRELLNVKLFEVSTTAFPAYPTTSAGVRAALVRKLTGSTSVLSVKGYAEACRLRDSMLTEWREGKTLSNDTMAALQEVLDLVATADEAVDDVQPLLAGLMGVPNPDASDDEQGSEGEDDDEAGDGDADPNASQESARTTVLLDRRLTALAAYTGLTAGV